MLSTNQQIRQLAEQLVIKAGKTLQKMQFSTTIVVQKDRQDISTTADIASERYIVEGIRSVYPDHQIQSEELGLSGNSSSGYLWIIDPLDGTKEYVRKIPMYNVAIAVEKDSQLIAAAIYRPYESNLYSASHNDGAYLNGQKIHVSEVNDLKNSFAYCYLPSYQRHPEHYDNSWNQLSNLGKNLYRLRSTADENTALCWLAQGGHEAYLNLSNPPKWHDIAPGILIAREAGAHMSHEEIIKIRHEKPGSLIIANNITIYKQISKILGE